MKAKRIALVTGGGGGIGAVICERLARTDALVVAASRGLDSCEESAQRVRAAGGEARALAMDVSDRQSVREALAGLRRELGQELPISWLVNNAGIAVSAPLLAVRSGAGGDLYERHMAVNFHGSRHLIEELLPDMLECSYGRIVNLISSAGIQGYAYVAAYCASKHALVGYTRAAALELGHTGVTINGVCPHYVDSPMLAESIARVVEKTGKSEREARDFFRSQNPDGELVAMEQVAQVVWRLLDGEDNGTLVELPSKEPEESA